MPLQEHNFGKWSPGSCRMTLSVCKNINRYRKRFIRWCHWSAGKEYQRNFYRVEYVFIVICSFVMKTSSSANHIPLRASTHCHRPATTVWSCPVQNRRSISIRFHDSYGGHHMARVYSAVYHCSPCDFDTSNDRTCVAAPVAGLQLIP